MPEVPPPYTIDQAVTDEQAFWAQIRELIADAVESATADATLAMKTVASTQQVVVERVNGVASQVAVVAASVTRLENLATSKSLVDNQLRERLDRLLSALEPNATRPTPPTKENGGS